MRAGAVPGSSMMIVGMSPREILPLVERRPSFGGLSNANERHLALRMMRSGGQPTDLEPST